MKTLAIALATALALLPAHRSFAGAGSLDPSFGAGGVVILPSIFPASPFDAGNKVLIQGDGKILIVGTGGGDTSGPWRSSFVAVRFNPDGSLDTSFGPEHDGYFVFPWGSGPAEARAVLIDPNGDIVIGGNEGNRAGVVWLHPDGTFDDTQGPEGNGTANFAVNDDDAHATVLNAMTIETVDTPPAYKIDFAGSYDGVGFPQMMLGKYDNPGPYDAQPNPYIVAIVPPGTNGNGYATSLLNNQNTGVLVGGSVQSSIGIPQCVVASYSSDICHVVGDDVICGEFSVDGYGNENGAFVDQFFSNEFGTAGDCYVDALASTGLFETIAAGREFFNGGIRAVYFSLNTQGQLQSFFNVFAMTPWGQNSPREVLPQNSSTWLFAGFSGVDSTGTSDPLVARVDVNTGMLDPTFGSGGVSQIDFDFQDFAYGETYGAALDAHGCIVSVGTYYNGLSDENGNDESQIFVSRVEGDSGGANDTIFRNGFDPAASVCGP